MSGGKKLFQPGNQYGKLGKRGRRSLQYYTKHLAERLEEDGVSVPLGLENPVEAATVFQWLKLALRNNDINPTVYCAKCKAYHVVKATAPCPRTPEHGDYPILVPDTAMEKNTVTALCKLADKMWPNLQNVSGTVNIEGKLVDVAQAVGQLIAEFVPAETRLQCLKKLHDYLATLQAEEA